MSAPPVNPPVGMEGWSPKLPPLIGTLADLKDYEKPAVEAYGRACARAGRDAALAQQPVAIPRLANCGKYTATDNTGQHFYLNHANTWQTFQGEQPAAVDDEMVEIVGKALWRYWDDAKGTVKATYRAKTRKALEDALAVRQQGGEK